MVEEKIRLIQQKIKDNYYLLVSDSSNIFYLTGIKNLSSEVYLLISKDKFFILTPLLTYSQIVHILNNPQNIVLFNKFSDKLRKILPNSATLEIDTENIPFKIYKILSKVVKNIKFTNLVTKLRLIKSEDEIKNIQQACRITNKIVQMTAKYLRLGISEIQVKNFILKTMAQYNVEPSFEPIVAFDQNTSFPHHVSCDKIYTKNSLVLIDIGCKYNGYCCDITRMLNIFNTKNRQVVNLYLKLQYLQKKLISLCRPGVKVKEIDLYAKKFFKKLGYAKNCLHSVGHGLGIDIHEPPRVSIKDNTILQPGMVVTIEPGIYFENKFGLRIEDDVLITNNGCKILSTEVVKTNVQ